jgi:UPF0755 protein
MALSTGSKRFLALMAVVVLLTGGVITAVNSLVRPEGRDSRTVTVRIPRGAAAAEVAEQLAAAEVIDSALAFRLLSKFDGRASQIKAGTYQLSTGMDTDELLDVLAAGPPRPDVFTVTIPEGLNVSQTLQRIADAEGSPFTVEELTAALPSVPLPAWVPAGQLPPDADPYEGMLFPSTYEFRADAAPAEVLGRLVEQSETVLAGLSPPANLDLYQTLIMASLIEREARIKEEQPLVSAVMHNRLAEPMRLQIDATVLYALGEHKERLLEEDLQVDSPWNTYRYEGLPPTPISGAGEAAIRAAASPAPAEFLYYVVADADTGAHAFAVTLEEHNANVAQYRQQQPAGAAG